MKVKEPLAAERAKLSRGQILFTYLHLAPDAEQTSELIASGATCIAYETVSSSNGGLPLLAPMSEVAGRLAPQMGAHCLERPSGGRGVLFGAVPGGVGRKRRHPGRRNLRYACGNDRDRYERPPRTP